MPQHILLIVAYLGGEAIASTLNFYERTNLYRRYWGCTQYIPNLHFELCYYQAQEFSIAEKIRFFEGGAQGKHKLARGFKPRPTCSFHKIDSEQLGISVKQFLDREKVGLLAYTNELEERVPYKN